MRAALYAGITTTIFWPFSIVIVEYALESQLASFMTIFYDPRCLEYSSPGHPERPERIARTAPFLKDRHPDWEWRKPTAVTDGQLLRAHSREHVKRVANALEHFDLDTLLYPNIEAHARRSAGAAIEATRCALRGEAGGVQFDARVRIDTPNEWEYYRHGGILHFVLRHLAG